MATSGNGDAQAGAAATPEPKRKWGPTPFDMALIAVVSIGAILYLVIRGGGGSADLGYRFAVGDHTEYRMTVRDRGTNTNADTRYDVTTTTTLGLDVTGVASNGAATMVARAGAATITGESGDPQHLGALGSQTVQVASDGAFRQSVLLIATPDGTVFGLLDPLLPIVSPDGVSPGDSWDVSATQAMPYGSGETRLGGTASLTRFDTLNGVHVAVVQSDLNEVWDLRGDTAQVAKLAGGTAPAGFVAWRGTEHVTMTSFVDTSNDRVVRSTVSGDYSIVITTSSSTPSPPIHNTGTFRQEADLVTS